MIMIREDVIGDEGAEWEFGRIRCPFYGLIPDEELKYFVYNAESDRCGLNLNNSTKCRMQTITGDVNWINCRENCTENFPFLEKLAKEYSVYFNQEREGGSMGFGEWFYNVMKYSIEDGLE